MPHSGPRPALAVLAAAILLALGVALTAPSVEAASRIKDISDFEGVRDNMLVGYGLVVGLDGTGDGLSNSPFTEQSLIGMLERLGVNVRDSSMTTKNVAAVMVTATLPPFINQGSRIDVTVSALGDSTSLMGGTLLVTPVLGADGEVYAVAQGPISVGGFSAEGKGTSITKGVPTGGRIANGAIVERELPFEILSLPSIRIALRNPDFTTARRMAQTINTFIGEPVARVLDSATVRIEVTGAYSGSIVDLMTDVEQLEVTPDQIARVVIDEQSGVIVMGANVRINTVAIAQGNLTIRITETPQVSQPNAFSNTGTTTTVDRTQVEVDEGEENKLTVLDSGVNLQDLVNGVNALGIGPRDLITILQAIKAAGALQAEIELM